MLKKWLFVILILSLIPTLAEAQKSAKGRRKKVRPKAEASIQLETSKSEERAGADEALSTVAATSKAPKSYWSAGVGVLLWQEAVEIKRAGATAKMQSQFKGLNFHAAYNRTRPTSYWQQHYGLEVGFGTLKGQGDQADIQDRLDNQTWILATFKPGLIYRTSPVARVGLMLPVVYRKIQWNFNAGSGLEAADKPFSIGIGFRYVQRLSKTSSLDLALIHQRMWATNLWSAAWNYEF